MPEFPPYLPERFRYSPDWWVGTRDPYAPQLSVTSDVSTEEINAAAQTQQPIIMRFSARTGDMEHDEPDDELGEHSIEVCEAWVNETGAGTINFMAVVDSLYGNRRNTIWVWDYAPGSSVCCDFTAE